MIGIYKITSPSGRVYIGQSWNIEKRWFKYRSDVSNLPQPILHASFLKYGAKNHIYEVIHELSSSCTQQEMDKWERYYIEFYKGRGVELMNCKEGGSAGKHSEETKRKISELQKGKRQANSGSFQKGHVQIMTQEHKERIAKSNTGKVRNEETREKMKERRKYQIIKHSEETKRKISIAHTGKKHSKEFGIKIGLAKIGNKYKLGKILSDESRRKISENRKGKATGERTPNIPVIDIKTGIIYKSINAAANLIGMSHDSLKIRLFGKIKNDTKFSLWEEK